MNISTFRLKKAEEKEFYSQRQLKNCSFLQKQIKVQPHLSKNIKKNLCRKTFGTKSWVNEISASLSRQQTIQTTSCLPTSLWEFTSLCGVLYVPLNVVYCLYRVPHSAANVISRTIKSQSRFGASSGRERGAEGELLNNGGTVKAGERWSDGQKEIKQREKGRQKGKNGFIKRRRTSAICWNTKGNLWKWKNYASCGRTWL